jgi:phosphoribosylanthranilate isomerase
MQLKIKVKICGITNVPDACAAIDAGADAVGFIFCEGSPRYITPAAAARVIAELPPLVSKVGVFANAAEEVVKEALAVCGLDVLQFHGDESPAYCRHFRRKVIKAFRMRGAEDLERLRNFPEEAWLLDSYVAGKLGGTGELFNWDLARKAVHLSNRVILAGGLTPENVAAAVREVRPFAVDVSSGVESAPGRKDHSKVRAFIEAAKGAAS